MVSMTDMTYFFHVELLYNDIPTTSVIEVTWPTNWELDCSIDYIATCIENCDDAIDITCDTDSSSLILFGGFETVYVSYGTGYVDFTIQGIKNPPITEEKFLTVTTKSNFGE
jgi:hypothetical protein